MTYQIIAILDRSAGNDSVGEMWQETKIFNSDEPIDNIMQWAAEKTHITDVGEFRSNLKLTIAQH